MTPLHTRSASVFTVDAMWSRPMRSPDRYSSGREIVGFALRSSPTAEAWVTVMSSSAPSAPSTMPASTRPLRSMAEVPRPMRSASSLATPVKCARFVNSVARDTVIASAVRVLSRRDGRHRPDAVGEVEREVRDRARTHDRDECRTVAVEHRRQHELQDHDQARAETDERAEAAQPAEGDHRDREQDRQPHEHRTALPVGVGVVERWRRVLDVIEHDGVARTEVRRAGRRRELDRAGLAGVRSLRQPELDLGADDAHSPARGAPARTLRDADDLRLVDVLDEPQLLDLAAHVAARPEHGDAGDGDEQEHDRGDREPAPGPARHRGVPGCVIVAMAHLVLILSPGCPPCCRCSTSLVRGLAPVSSGRLSTL